MCFHVEIDALNEAAFGSDKVAILQWILKEPQQITALSRESKLTSTVADKDFIIEIGPRFVYTHYVVFIDNKIFPQY